MLRLHAHRAGNHGSHEAPALQAAPTQLGLTTRTPYRLQAAMPRQPRLLRRDDSLRERFGDALVACSVGMITVAGEQVSLVPGVVRTTKRHS